MGEWKALARESSGGLELAPWFSPVVAYQGCGDGVWRGGVSGRNRRRLATSRKEAPEKKVISGVHGKKEGFCGGDQCAPSVRDHPWALSERIRLHVCYRFLGLPEGSSYWGIYVNVK